MVGEKRWEEGGGAGENWVKRVWMVSILYALGSARKKHEMGQHALVRSKRGPQTPPGYRRFVLESRNLVLRRLVLETCMRWDEQDMRGPRLRNPVALLPTANGSRLLPQKQIKQW